MTKGPSPLLGYNTNVRHKGRVFHIQTEDSGVAHPHVITHLFADGGRILKSNKTSYAELVGAPDMAAQVKKIMQDQHKAMFIALRDGQFDHLFDATAGDSKEVSAPAVSGDLLSSAQVASAEPARRPSVSGALPPPPSTSAVKAPSPSSPALAEAPAVTEAKRSSSVSIPAIRPPMPPGVNPSEAVMRPPSTVPSSPSMAPTRPSSAPASATLGRPASQKPPPRPTGASGHYQAIRAPEILSSFKPKEESSGAPTSIFGDGLMSEKSLDEVILAYLAEDLDDSKR
jgi:hypothetical protein